MSAGLPLLVVAVLASTILAAWLIGGAGSRRKRFAIFCIAMLLLYSSWMALLFYGVFHPIGDFAMVAGFIISFLIMFVPVFLNRVGRNDEI